MRLDKHFATISDRAQSSRGDHDPAGVRADTGIYKHKYLPGLADGVRTRSVNVIRPPNHGIEEHPWFFLDCEQNPQRPGGLPNTCPTSELWSVKGYE